MKIREMRDMSKRCPVDGLARSVLFVLLTHVDDEPLVWPSQHTIADILGYKERAIRNAVIALEKAGVIERTGRRPYGSTEYRINIEMLAAQPAHDDNRHITTTGTICRGDRHNMPEQPARYAAKEQGSAKEEIERASAPKSTSLFPDENPNADLKAKRKPNAKPKKTACPWPTVDAMLADPEVMRLAAEKGMRNGTVNAQAAQFLAHHDEKGSRFVDWHRAWGVTWCQRWADWGAKQSHAPAAATAPQGGPVVYRVHDTYCDRRLPDGSWTDVMKTPAEILDLTIAKIHGVEFDWTGCSPARAAELQAELAAKQERAA